MAITPKVTVAITAFEQPRFLNQAIESALKQDHSNLEVLVIDDGSSPPLKESIREIGNPKVSYHYMEHKGLPFGLINAINMAKGKYIAILDHDDTLTEKSIEKRVAALENKKDAAISYGDISYMDINSRIYASISFKQFKNSTEFIRAMLQNFIVPIKHSGVMFDKDKAISSGNYRPIPEEFDNEFIIRLATKYEVVHVPSIVANYRTYSGNTSGMLRHRMNSLKRRLMIIDEYINCPYRKSYYKALNVAMCLLKTAYFAVTSKRPSFVCNMLEYKN